MDEAFPGWAVRTSAGALSVERAGAPGAAREAEPEPAAGGDDFDELQPASNATMNNQRTARLYADRVAAAS
ncbi:MAG: hypothetical protein IPH44_34525 [Myxococcales bacterium]|jgi:hypothetical protein|nr:hypothetical protein [Myxococcales bacterium]